MNKLFTFGNCWKFNCVQLLKLKGVSLSKRCSCRSFKDRKHKNVYKTPVFSLKPEEKAPRPTRMHLRVETVIVSGSQSVVNCYRKQAIAYQQQVILDQLFTI
ncbi:unnamed protein product [Clavelina lepadiformis]|uniref:Uncharacterized protein n=1 Tax=Clavelina lepadiformis TaxID=159417 RepID=A0ABP0GSZ1_CLALP